MAKHEFLALWLLLLLFRFTVADIGTASHYDPPYTPTACYGGSLTPFPASNLFAAAGAAVWDNGAACGREYLVRCISSAVPKACLPGQAIIKVKIVDRAASAVSRPAKDGATLVLSNTAFQAIADPTVPLLNIEFKQI